jgi:hypothetical protein
VYSRLELVNGSGPFYLFPESGLTLALSMGTALMRATVLVNGRLLSDSIEYRTRFRTYVDLAVSRDPAGNLKTLFASQFSGNIYISPNSQVDFINNLNAPLDVIFEHPDEAKGDAAGSAGGNITALQPRTRVSRWFPALGDHFFTVQSGSDSRRISVTVKDE